MLAERRQGSCRAQEDLAALRGEWTELHERAPRATTFNGFEHVELWYRLFAPPGAIRVFPIRRDGKLLGFLPLVLERRKGVRILRSLTDAHCLHGGTLAGADAGPDFARAVLEALGRERDWDILLLEHEYSFEGAPILPDEELRASGLGWERRAIPTFSITLGKPFEEYYRKDLSKKRRHYFQGYQNKVERAGGAGFEHLQGTEALAAWDEFTTIEDSGWKGAGGTSILRETPAVREYYRGLLELLATQGKLELAFLILGGKRIAGGFGHLQNGVFHLSKIGYREEFAGYAPSNLLLLHLVQRAAESCSERDAIHLYPYDFGYKHRFVNVEAESVATYVFNTTWRGRAARLWRTYRKRTRREARTLPSAEEAAPK